MKNRLPFALDEKTRVNLQFNNFWAILVSVVMISFSLALVYSQQMSLKEKQQETLAAVLELKKELGDWKKQTESRIGGLESDQNSVISFLENHLSVKISRAIRIFR